jgi:hypothetical protein
MSAVDPRSDPLESFGLVAQDFEGLLRHVSRTPNFVPITALGAVLCLMPVSNHVASRRRS